MFNCLNLSVYSYIYSSSEMLVLSDRFTNYSPEAFIVPIGLIVSLLIATLLGIGGWYGKELSFRHKVGVISSNDI